MLKEMVARRYAKALLDAAVSQGIEAVISGQFASFMEMLKECSDMRYLLTNPSFTPNKKRGFLKELSAKSNFDENFSRFLILLNDKGRIAYIEDVYQNYTALLDERQGLSVAELYYAEEVPDDVLERIVSQLKRISGKEVRLEKTKDASLIAGVKVQMGGVVYDGSLKNKLDMLRTQLVTE